MKIVFKVSVVPNYPKIEEIMAGEVFRPVGNYYWFMKVYGDTRLNAVRLFDGFLCSYSLDTKVERKNGAFVEE